MTDGRPGSYTGWKIKPADTVDLRELRRHHQRTARRLRDEVKRRRELETECEQLRRLVVEISIRWYGTGEGQLPGLLAGGSSSAFYGVLGRGLDDVDVGEDNPDRG
jgi:hypothetical protein